MPGQEGRNRRMMKIVAAQPAPTSAVGTLTVEMAWINAPAFGIRGPGSACAKRSPARSFNWLAAMVTATPQVKPTVTACGR